MLSLNLLICSGLVASVSAAPSPSQISLAKEQDNIQQSATGLCWAACFPDQPKCPEEFTAKQFGECWTCCIREVTAEPVNVKAPSRQDLDLTTVLTSTSIPTEVEVNIKDSNSNANDVCLKMCFEKEPECPQEWHSKKFDTCWTCCRSLQNSRTESTLRDLVTIGTLNNQTPNRTPHGTSSKVHLKTIVKANKLEPVPQILQICLKVCWFDTPTCPNGWYSNNFGSADMPCWTCCKSPDDTISAGPLNFPTIGAKQQQDAQLPATVSPKKGGVGTWERQDPCLMVCWQEEPKCPSGWYDRNAGTKDEPCFTCCRKMQDDDEITLLL